MQEKNLMYFSFFLHHYEPQLNKRIKTFLGVDGGDLYDTDRFIDIKLSCREQMLQKLMDYDPAKGAEYATYIFPFIRDAMLRFRMGEEKWSVSSLTNYKMVHGCIITPRMRSVNLPRNTTATLPLRKNI